MDTNKLPEWPDDDPAADWTDCMVRDRYHEALAEAALARMEALVEYAQHTKDCNLPHDFPCCCGLDELLAACERPEERRDQ